MDDGFKQVQVDIGDKKLGQCEGDCVNEVCCWVELFEYEFWYGVYIGVVVEGYYDDVKEYYCGYSVDLKVMDCWDVDLGFIS